MPRRFRRSFKARAGRPSLRFEWAGFRDAGAAANLNTSVVFELIPPDGASSVVNLLPRVRRVVGSLDFSLQNTVTSPTEIGWVFFMGNVQGDQTIDNSVPPLTTDPDEFGLSQIVQWQTYRDAVKAVANAEFDSTSMRIPIDFKLNRPMKARDTFVLRIDAGTTARARVSVNLRVLMQVHAQ